MEGVLDVLSLVCVVELANVLNEWGYTSTHHRERVRIIRARQRARELVHWIAGTQEFQEAATSDLIDLERQCYWTWLAQIAWALLTSRQEVEKTKGFTGRSSREVEVAIQRCFHLEPDLLFKYQRNCEKGVPPNICMDRREV